MPFGDDYQRLLKSAHIFALTLMVSEILTFKNIDLQNLGQGREVQHGPIRWRISTFIKDIIEQLSLALTVFHYHFKL